MGGSERLHHWIVEKLRERPQIAGIEEETFYAKCVDYGLYYQNILLVLPDLYYQTPNGEYFVEVKSAHNPFLFKKGMFQLEKTLDAHLHNGLEEPDIRLWMANQQGGRYWIDHLLHPKIYRVGDSFNKPSIEVDERRGAIGK